jgi:hypothetical protein
MKAAPLRRFASRRADLLAEDLALGHDGEPDLGEDESVVQVAFDERDGLAGRIAGRLDGPGLRGPERGRASARRSAPAVSSAPGGPAAVSSSPSPDATSR